MNPSSRLRRVLILLAIAVTLLIGGQAYANESPMVQSVTLSERGRDLVLSADVTLSLNHQLEDAAERGLPLYFTVEVQINRPRWYWFDETVLTATQTWRIIHNPLTHQWRVSSGSLALPVSSLSEALSVVRHIRNWRIADRDQFKPNSNHEGRMRVRFDVSQLSKAFQVNALNSSDWSLATPWTEFSVALAREPGPPPAASPAPAPASAPVLNGNGLNGSTGQGLTLPEPGNGGMMGLPSLPPAAAPVAPATPAAPPVESQ